MTADTLAQPPKKKRTFGAAKPQPVDEVKNETISSEELEKAQKENKTLKAENKELKKAADASSEIIAKANEEKAALEKSISELIEKYDDIYIPQGYKIGKVLIDKTISYSKQADVFGAEYFEANPENSSIMVASIETTGLAQPIVVREIINSNGELQYEIIIGHTRVRAFEILQSKDYEKYKDIEAKIYALGTLSNERADDLFFESNFAQRGKLPVRATAKCVAHFAKKFKKRHTSNSERSWHEAFAERFHMAKASIFEWQAVAKLNDEYIQLIEDRKLKQKYASKIAKLSSEVQAELWEKGKSYITNKNLSIVAIAENESAESVLQKLIDIENVIPSYKKKYTISFGSEKDYELFQEWRKNHKSISVTEIVEKQKN